MQSCSKHIESEGAKKTITINKNELLGDEGNLPPENLKQQSYHENKEFEKAESLIVRKNASNITKQFVDSYAQTEWSSILVSIHVLF
jgi:hypothetical protein